MITVESFYVCGALFQKFLTQATVSPDVRSLDGHMIEKFVRRQFVIPLKIDAVHLVFLTAIDVVDDENLIRTLLEIDRYGDVCISFPLKVVDQIALTLFHQITIDGSLRVDWDELFHLSSSEERDDAQFGASGADNDDR